ncbi:hypothetical protein [Blastopirellula retiformator]|uniref:Uncharacterized protein n=1 Tax=Blastopirellula retiformator TaxID=2527970 RepID=A0A5C5V411_9BACT|nr:hypothetical protein [Blastopirellula retiformator]TWT32780.1 hypothetical protein Enr8_25860 [Blastopirellula retiformator]
MNAIALVLCSVIAGADARETIPSVKSLSALINRCYEIDKIGDVELVDDGAWLQATGAFNSRELPFGTRVAGYRQALLIDKYQLCVIPCAEQPCTFLAGYVRFDDEKNQSKQQLAEIHRLSVRTAFCVLVDVDQNVVVKLDDRNAQLYLDDARHEALSSGMNAIWDAYLLQIESQTEGAPFVSEYGAFRNQFVTPPPIKGIAQARFTRRSRNGSDERFTGVFVSVTFAADGCEATHSETIDMCKLLRTSLAIPATQYFAAATNIEKEVP